MDSSVRLFVHKDEIRAIPQDSAKILNILTKHLYIMNAGTLVGTVKQNKVVPGHAAALSVHLRQDLWPEYAVDQETAIRYLRKEVIDTVNLPRGFALVKYEGLPLGWVNVLDTRVNNLFPAEWRIRAQAKPDHDTDPSSEG
jgi:NOL1/NOP2/fmu family ribosome biogenesis protein